MYTVLRNELYDNLLKGNNSITWIPALKICFRIYVMSVK